MQELSAKFKEDRRWTQFCDSTKKKKSDKSDDVT